MKKKTIKKSFLIGLFISIFHLSFAQGGFKELVDYVDPFIGVADDISNCVIGPQLPFGSINPSPQTKKGSHDGYSPDEPIRGFGQLHVSGVGWGKYGQGFVSPQIGLAIGEEDHDSEKKDERAAAYEYSVNLSRYNIQVDVTPSYHSAIYRFTFPESKDANILFDLSHHIAKDIEPRLGGVILDGSFNVTEQSDTEVKGYGNYKGGFGDSPYRVYYCIRLNKVPHHMGTWNNGVINTNSRSEEIKEHDDRIGVYFGYNTKAKEEIYLKIAVSFKSIEQATYWLDTEIPDFNYEKVKSYARNKWNEALNKITVEGITERNKKIFYTALYHTHIMPRDRTNDSEDFSPGVPVWDDHFAVWDTWRTLYPLHVLITPSMVSGTLNSFIARLEKNKMVKDCFISGKEMFREQGGNDIDNIIADAYIKGIKGVNWKDAYKVLTFNADNERQGSYGWNKQDETNTYKTLGWIASGRMSCSMTVEYAYNDFCTAQVAKGLGFKKDYKKYLERSSNWINLWNPEIESDGFKGFIMPKDKHGNFIEFDPKAYPGSWKEYYYEGSAWTYSFFAPHQFEKLIELSGGKDIFIERLKHGLNKGFVNIGNEPSFVTVHAFHYCNRSDLASLYVRKLIKERFNEKGYSGNDDSGAMSSWYIFSCMGFFPNAGQDIYYLTGPTFKEITLLLDNNKKLTISAPNTSPENIYIKAVTINGKKWNKPWISHKDIQNGGSIIFEMTDKPLDN